MKVFDSYFLQIFSGQFILEVDDGNRDRRYYPKSGVLSDSFLLAQGRVFFTINSSDSKNTPVLIGPFIHFWYESFAFAICGFVELDD